MTDNEFAQTWATMPTTERAALLASIAPQERELRDKSATITQERHMQLLKEAYEQRATPK
jgi:acyl-CoA reductase-like NAD-dependent aldehyde dehydrogenase